MHLYSIDCIITMLISSVRLYDSESKPIRWDIEPDKGSEHKVELGIRVSQGKENRIALFNSFPFKNSGRKRSKSISVVLTSSIPLSIKLFKTIRQRGSALPLLVFPMEAVGSDAPDDVAPDGSSECHSGKIAPKVRRRAEHRRFENCHFFEEGYREEVGGGRWRSDFRCGEGSTSWSLDSPLEHGVSNNGRLPGSFLTSVNTDLPNFSNTGRATRNLPN